MKVLLFIVNYRSDEPLRQCIASAQQVARDASVNLQIHVLDNSEYPCEKLAALKQMLSEFSQVPAQLHVPDRNSGYFGSLALAQRLAELQGSDVVIYSNPDVRFAPDFFDQLGLHRLRAPGLIAPAIVSREDGFDQNPKYVHRLTRAKLLRLQRIYATSLGFRFYMNLARLKEWLLGKRARGTAPAGKVIYAPHGATLIFTDPDFFRSLPSYPCFLFGEELFVAEEAMRREIPITYQPALKVEDLRSHSVGQLPGEFHRRLMLTSVEFILSRYYAADQ